MTQGRYTAQQKGHNISFMFILQTWWHIFLSYVLFYTYLTTRSSSELGFVPG